MRLKRAEEEKREKNWLTVYRILYVSTLLIFWVIDILPSSSLCKKNQCFFSLRIEKVKEREFLVDNLAEIEEIVNCYFLNDFLVNTRCVLIYSKGIFKMYTVYIILSVDQRPVARYTFGVYSRLYPNGNSWDCVSRCSGKGYG